MKKCLTVTHHHWLCTTSYNPNSGLQKYFCLLPCTVNHLMTPLIYLVTPFGDADPQVGNHLVKIMLNIGPWTLDIGSVNL